MAEEILQVMGFDAEQALETLKSLDSGFATFESRLTNVMGRLDSFNKMAGKTVSALKHINREARLSADQLERIKTPRIDGGLGSGQPNLLTSADAERAMNDLLGITTKNANEATSAVVNLGSASEREFNRARRAASGYAVSLETIVRVVSTQIIVRSLNALRNAVEDSFQGNIEFTKSLAEIQTLESDKTIRELGSEVRNLSDSFNIPLLEVAAAKFEAIQNGFAGASQQANVFSASSAFARTAVASMNDSVSLITGTLNAFAMDAEEAELVAAKLFRTVDTGKVLGSELARGLGRISPAAKELGISLDEQLAALSTITIAGVPASEALTQIRGAMTALIKPSEDAKEAMRKLGFENGQQLIRAYGLVGAFQALISTTDGQVNSIGQLFRNSRALNGILRLTNSGLEDYHRILKEIAGTDVAQFQEILERRLDTDAERVTRSLNKLRNFFTDEMGRELVSALNKLFSNVGGIETLIDAMRALAAPVATLTGLLASFGLAAGATNLAIKLSSINFAEATPTIAKWGESLLGAEKAADLAGKAATGLQGAIAGLVLVLGARASGDFLGRRLVGVLDDAVAKYNEAQEKIVRRGRAADDRLLAQEIEKNQEIVRANERMIAEKRRLYFADIDNARSANALLINDSKSVLDRLIGVYEQHGRERARIADQFGREVQSSQQRELALTRELEDRRFDLFNQRFDQATQFTNLLKRTNQLTAQAARSLSSARTPEDRELALGDFRRAQAAAEQALSIAEQNDNLQAKLTAERQIQKVLEQQIAAEKQLQALSERERRKAEADAARAAERVKQMNQAAKDFLESADFFTAEGPKDADQIAAQREKAQRALQDFFRLSAEGNQQISISDLQAFRALQRDLSASITDVEIRKLQASPEALRQLESQIRGAVANFDVIISATPGGEDLRELGATEGFAEASRRVANLNEQLAETVKRLNEVREGEERIRRMSAGGRVVREVFDVNPLSNLIPVEGFFHPELPAQYGQLQEQIIAASTDSQFLIENFESLTKQVAVFADRWQMQGIAGSTAVDNILRAHHQLLLIVKERQRLADEFPDVFSGEAEATANRLRSELQINKAITDALQQESEKAAQNALNTQAALNGTVAPTAQLASNLDRAATSMERIQRAASAISLTPPPTSVPQPVAQPRPQFFPQLQSMTPRQPASAASAASAGDVTNINGVTINVNGSESPRATAREIAAQLDRLHRRSAV